MSELDLDYTDDMYDGVPDLDEIEPTDADLKAIEEEEYSPSDPDIEDLAVDIDPEDLYPHEYEGEPPF